MNKWDQRFLDLAEHVAQWSKDPSTKTGAVIVRPDKTVASLGYNGFPRGIPDRQEWLSNREEKYKRVIHCEMNAILNAREPLQGYTLYTFPFLTCGRCAVHVIQAGIKQVIAPTATGEQLERWADSFELAMELYGEAGVDVTIYD
jgi:dCMP deaminase